MDFKIKFYVLLAKMAIKIDEKLPKGRIPPEHFAAIFRPDSGGPLGKGSYGQVFKVTHLPSAKEYALKLFEKESPENVVGILTEIQIGMILDHPNICKIHCFAEDDKAIYIIMDLIDGCNLLQFLKDYPGVLLKNPILFWKMAEHITAALEYLHSRGIVHCDIKLENIMVEISKDSVIQYIKLVDFGFSRDVRDVSQFHGGTSHYKAPEIILKKSRRFEIDIWAFGITVFALITGNFPSQLESKNPDDTQRKKEVKKKLRDLGSMPSDQPFDPFLDPQRDYSEIPDEVKALIRSCLIVNQASRPTAADLRRRIQKILSSFDKKGEA
jgi:calcium-dependent protein kinase